MLHPLIAGFLTGGSLIIAIGAQNAFVLQQGIKQNYPVTIAMTCGIVDSVLIIAGCLGLGAIISNYPLLQTLALYFGIAFLLFYAARSFLSAIRPQQLTAKGKNIGSYKQAIITTMAFSLLNPHVYLDTVILIGSISTAYAGINVLYFTFGACLASWLWFFSLALGAKKVSRFFQSARSWFYLDIVIGCIMCLIAWKLYAMTL